MEMNEELIGKKVKLLIRSRKAIYCIIEKMLDNRLWIVTEEGKHMIITSGIVEGVEVIE